MNAEPLESEEGKKKKRWREVEEKKNPLINVWCERGAATDALTVNSRG